MRELNVKTVHAALFLPPYFCTNARTLYPDLDCSCFERD